MLDALSLPQPLSFRLGTAVLRRATPNDIDALIALLSDDPISAARGDTADAGDRVRYLAALHEVLASPSDELLVAEWDGEVVATFQLTRIPGLARRGAVRLLVEAVRVRAALRSSGIGSAMMRWVTDTAGGATGSDLVQLTSDQARTEAHRFYERLGFVGSHLGFKYALGEERSASATSP